MPTPQDKWPKYWAPDRAFYLDQRAAALCKLDQKPFGHWTADERLRVALVSLKWENIPRTLADRTRELKARAAAAEPPRVYVTGTQDP